MNVDILFTLIIFLLLAVVIPLLGVRDFRLLLRRTSEGDTNARVKFYKGVLTFHWPLTIGFLAWWLLSVLVLRRKFTASTKLRDDDQ